MMYLEKKKTVNYMENNLTTEVIDLLARTDVIFASCDGGCNRAGSGGCACFDGLSYYGYKVNGKATNNICEYMGLINLLTLLRGKGTQEKPYCILMDSQLVVEQVNGNYRVKSAGLIELHAKATSLLSCIDASLHWVPRSVPIMQKVDKIAKEMTISD